ncbi:MAG: nucleotidyltransferase family protein, partial [Gammaproteobacteria bacterium]
LQSPEWPAVVELHVHPVDLTATGLLTAAEVCREAKPVPWHGGELSLPSPTHFLMHNVIHAFVVDFRQRVFLSLRQLFEFVQANRVYSERIDWPAIVARFDSQGYQGAIRKYAAFADAYLGFQAPPGLTLGRWEQWRPILHRIRTDLSHPAIEFPLAVAALIQLRTRNLLKAPGKLKKLITREFYGQNWQHVRKVSRHNASWRSMSQGRLKTDARSPR